MRGVAARLLVGSTSEVSLFVRSCTALLAHIDVIESHRPPALSYRRASIRMRMARVRQRLCTPARLQVRTARLSCSWTYIAHGDAIAPLFYRHLDDIKLCTQHDHRHQTSVKAVGKRSAGLTLSTCVFVLLPPPFLRFLLTRLRSLSFIECIQRHCEFILSYRKLVIV